MTKKRKTKKSNHKHQYEPCVFEYPGIKLDTAHGFVPGPDERRIGSYCKICGKISAAAFDDWYCWDYISHRSKPTDAAVRQLDPSTRTLPTFRLKNMFDSEVQIST